MNAYNPRKVVTVNRLLLLATAGLLSGCYSLQPIVYYAPPQPMPLPVPVPQYVAPLLRPEPLPVPEPAAPPPAVTEEPLAPPARPEKPAVEVPPPAPARPATRATVPSNSVPLMGFRPMRGQQGL